MTDVYFVPQCLVNNALIADMYQRSGMSDDDIGREYGIFNGRVVRLLSVWYMERGVYGPRTHALLIGDLLDDAALQAAGAALAAEIQAKTGLRTVPVTDTLGAVRMRRLLHTHFLNMELCARLAFMDGLNGMQHDDLLMPLDMQWRPVHHIGRQDNYDIASALYPLTYLPWTHSVRNFGAADAVVHVLEQWLEIDVVATPAAGIHVCGGVNVCCGDKGPAIVVVTVDSMPSVARVLALVGCTVGEFSRLPSPQAVVLLDYCVFASSIRADLSLEAARLIVQRATGMSETAAYGLLEYVRAILAHFFQGILESGANPYTVASPVWFPHGVYENVDSGRFQMFEGMMHMWYKLDGDQFLGCVAREDAHDVGSSVVLQRALLCYISWYISHHPFTFLDIISGVTVLIYTIMLNGVCKQTTYDVLREDVVALYWRMLDSASAVMYGRLFVLRQAAILPSSAEFQDSVVGLYMRGDDGALENALCATVVAVENIDVGGGSTVNLRMCATPNLKRVTRGGQTRATSRLHFWCYDPLPADVVAAIGNRVTPWFANEPGEEAIPAASQSGADMPAAISAAANPGLDNSVDNEPTNIAANPGGQSPGGQSPGGQSPGGQGAVVPDHDTALAAGQVAAEDLARRTRPPEPLIAGDLEKFPYLDFPEVRNKAFSTPGRIQTYDDLGSYVPDPALHTIERQNLNGLIRAIAIKVFKAHKIALQLHMHRELMRVCNQHNIKAGIEKWSDEILEARHPLAIIMRYTHMYYNTMVQAMHRDGFYMRSEAVKRFGAHSQRFLMTFDAFAKYREVENGVDSGDFWLRRLVRLFGCDAETQAQPWVTQNATAEHFGAGLLDIELGGLEEVLQNLGGGGSPNLQPLANVGLDVPVNVSGQQQQQQQQVQPLSPSAFSNALAAYSDLDLSSAPVFGNLGGGVPSNGPLTQFGSLEDNPAFVAALANVDFDSLNIFSGQPPSSQP